MHIMQVKHNSAPQEEFLCVCLLGNLIYTYNMYYCLCRLQIMVLEVNMNLTSTLEG